MKNITLLVFLTFANWCESNAQMSQTDWAMQYLAFRPDSLNPALELSRMDSAIQVLYPNDTSEGGPRRDFARYKEFAEPRLPNSATPVSFARAYSDALVNAKQFNGCTGTYTGSFTNIGPVNFSNYQNQGWVSDVWVDPDEIAGDALTPNHCGLFRWPAYATAIDDDVPGLGCIMIKSLKVNPDWYSQSHFKVKAPHAPYTNHSREPPQYRIAVNMAGDDLAFQISPSEPNVAYQIIGGNVRTATIQKPTLTWRLARGLFLSEWNWNEKTESLVSFTPTGKYEFRYSDLAIDPKDANRVFVSFALINSQRPGIHRVHVSNDGAVTFTDMSTGLPELPVNCLVYQNGSDDILYAATDDGVYYWDKSQQYWIRMGNLPRCIVQHLELDYLCGKLLVTTYGMGLWEGDLYQSDSIHAVNKMTSPSCETFQPGHFEATSHD